MKSEMFAYDNLEESMLLSILRDRDNLFKNVSEKEILESWSKISRLAMIHKVLPQLYQISKESGLALSKDENLQLQKTFHQIATFNLLLTAHLLTLTKTLEKSGFDYITIKGPALSMELYGDISLRQYGDIDIFVDQNDMLEICRQIETLGYDPVLPATLLNRSKFYKLDNDFSFIHRSSGILLELHWKLFPERHKMPLPFHELHSRACTLHLHHRKITILSPEDNLVYLSLHGAKHIFERIGWVYDLDRLIRRYPGLDFQQAHSQSEKMGAEEAFLSGIFLAQLLFDTPLPKKIEALYNEHIDRLVKKILQYYRDGFLFRDESTKKRARFLFLAELHKSSHSKALSLFVSILKPSAVDVITFSLPDKWDFLYPALRPFRLLDKHIFRRLLPA